LHENQAARTPLPGQNICPSCPHPAIPCVVDQSNPSTPDPAIASTPSSPALVILDDSVLDESNPSVPDVPDLAFASTSSSPHPVILAGSNPAAFDQGSEQGFVGTNGQSVFYSFEELAAVENNIATIFASPAPGISVLFLHFAVSALGCI